MTFDAVLFDIDNVLIDTRHSYLAAIQKTIERYLNRPGIVSPREVDQFKLLGGFNDDWDCCYGMITFLETAIQGKPIRFGDHRRQRLSISELGKIFPERPLGVEGLLKNLRILYERVEVPPYQKIAKIFQEVYLGKGRTAGLVRKEKPIFPKSILEKIRHRGVRLGIVTGRNRFEARHALKRFGILKLFDCLITIDEVRREEKKKGRFLRKPDPWPILEAARRFPLTPTSCERLGAARTSGRPPLDQAALSPKGRGQRSSPRRGKGKELYFLYVGDLPDDILAARRAKKTIRIQSAAFPKFTRDPETALRELKKVKPDFYLKEPKDLLRILS